MTAELYLEQFALYEQKIEDRIAEIQRLEALSQDVSPHLSDIKVKSSSDPHQMQGVWARLVDARDELSKDVDNLIDLEIEIRRNLKKLSPLEHDVLVSLYIQHHSVQKVANEKNYTRQAIYAIKERALEKLQKILNS